MGVARALAADPPVMLMDEPFGAVDPIVRDRLQNEFLRLQDDLAKTILFVTHDIDEAIKMGDLVAVMEKGGRLAQFAPPDEILAGPASGFVARFVGADRGLKRLALARVRTSSSARRSPRDGEAVGAARARVLADPFPFLLLVDEEGRPTGWIDAARRFPPRGRSAAGPWTPAWPALGARTTLKDALSMLLANEVQAGVVVDRDGRPMGSSPSGWSRTGSAPTPVTQTPPGRGRRDPAGAAGQPGADGRMRLRDRLGVAGRPLPERSSIARSSTSTWRHRRS